MSNETLFEGNNSWSTKITANNNNDDFIELLNPLLLLESKLNIIKHLYYYDVSFRIEGFRLLISIESLPEAPFPDIYPEDSAGVRNNKLLQTEYHNPNIIFRMFKEQGDSHYELGDIYLQNRKMQYNKGLLRPYLCDGNIPIKLWGLENKLKVRLVNSGNGLLTGNDYLECEIDYSYTINGLEKQGVGVQPNNFGKIINTGTPQLLLPANSKRVKLNFKNEGESIISFAFGLASDCVIGQSPELKPTQAFNDESRYLFQQALYVIAQDEPCLVSGIEGSVY